jgi:hypothetical protein
VANWASPFNLTEQPSEATLNLIANNISLSHPSIRTITLSILPPVFFRSVPSFLDSQGLLERSERVVGGFLEGWTKRVGDPVISKWIVVVLLVSMFLNARLLSAARRGAMQPIQTITKPNESEKSTDTAHKPPSHLPPPTAVTSNENAAKFAPSFTLNDSEDDDKEDPLSVSKKGGRRTRSLSECMQILTSGQPQDLSDEEVVALTIQKKIPLYALEKTLKDLERAVKIRRAAVCTISSDYFADIFF